MKLTTENVMQFVLKTDNCWLWQGTLDRNGYGIFRVGGHRTVSRMAHKLVYVIHKGEIPAGKVLMHSCDNPQCVNPHHLTPGTQKENIQDAIQKGRMLVGEKNGQCKLTDEQVREIYQLAHSGNYTQKEIGKMFGVSQVIVSQIKTQARRKTSHK